MTVQTGRQRLRHPKKNCYCHDCRKHNDSTYFAYPFLFSSVAESLCPNTFRHKVWVRTTLKSSYVFDNSQKIRRQTLREANILREVFPAGKT